MYYGHYILYILITLFFVTSLTTNKKDCIAITLLIMVMSTVSHLCYLETLSIQHVFKQDDSSTYILLLLI